MWRTVGLLIRRAFQRLGEEIHRCTDAGEHSPARHEDDVECAVASAPIGEDADEVSGFDVFLAVDGGKKCHSETSAGRREKELEAATREVRFECHSLRHTGLRGQIPRT